jgi:hypothetical protein
MPHTGNKFFKFSPREFKFKDIYSSGCLIKDAARAVGYRGSCEQTLSNTNRAILLKKHLGDLAQAPRAYNGPGCPPAYVPEVLRAI